MLTILIPVNLSVLDRSDFFLHLSQFCLVTSQIVIKARRAITYLIQTSSAGGITATTTFTTTYMPPQMLEAKIKYSEPINVFFIPHPPFLGLL